MTPYQDWSRHALSEWSCCVFFDRGAVNDVCVTHIYGFGPEAQTKTTGCSICLLHFGEQFINCDFHGGQVAADHDLLFNQTGVHYIRTLYGCHKISILPVLVLLEPI